MEGSPGTWDARFAEWYSWAKREMSTESRVCLGAAQAAIEVLEGGGDEQAAQAAARRSVAGQGIALSSRVPARRRAYAEWYDWARKELRGGPERQHAAAAAAMDRLDRGADAAEAAAAAREAVAMMPGTGGVATPPQQAVPPPASQEPAVADTRQAAAPSGQAPWTPPAAATAPEAAPAAASPWAPPAAQAAASTVTYAPQAPAQAAPAWLPHAYGPPTVAAPAPPHVYGGLLRRLGAAVIDSVLIAIGTVILAFVVSFFAVVGVLSTGQPLTDTSLSGVSLALVVIVIVLQWLYFAGLESSAWQATVGKRVFHLVVTDNSARRISFGRATARYAPKAFPVVITLIALVALPIIIVLLAAALIDLVSLVPLLLMIPLTQRRQGLQDIMAGTVVVRAEHLSQLAAPLHQVQPQGHPGGAGEVQGA